MDTQDGGGDRGVLVSPAAPSAPGRREEERKNPCFPAFSSTFCSWHGPGGSGSPMPGLEELIPGPNPLEFAFLLVFRE